MDVFGCKWHIDKDQKKKRSVNRKKRKDRVIDQKAPEWSGWSLDLQCVYLPLYKRFTATRLPLNAGHKREGVFFSVVITETDTRG